MIIICGDCADEMGFAKVWRYPCEDCAKQFVDHHRGLGHVVRAREERKSDWHLRVPL